MSITVAHSIWTVLLLILFVGIVVWAWSGKQRRRFEEAARLPLDDDDRPRREVLRAGTSNSGENSSG